MKPRLDIIRARHVLNWTQAELARAAHIKPASLGHIERGFHKPNDVTDALLCHVLGLPTMATRKRQEHE